MLIFILLVSCTPSTAILPAAKFESPIALGLSRIDWANIYHMTCETYHLYTTMRVVGLNNEFVLHLLDRNPFNDTNNRRSDHAMVDIWSKMFKNITFTPPEGQILTQTLGYDGFFFTETYPKTDIERCIFHKLTADYVDYIYNLYNITEFKSNRLKIVVNIRKQQSHENRIIENLETYLKNQLDGYDVTYQDFATIGFQQQLNLVTQADILIGVHGAGLTHVLYMRPGTLLIQLTSPPKANHLYGLYDIMAKARGVQHILVNALYTDRRIIKADVRQFVDNYKKQTFVFECDLDQILSNVSTIPYETKKGWQILVK